MADGSAKLRAKHKFKRRRRQVEDLSVTADEKFEKHFIKRVTSLFEVRRFVIGWITFLVVLSVGVTMQLRALRGNYQQLAPVSGGIYTEGMMGSFTNASPLYATGLVDNTVSRLIFSGLLKYDSDNNLVVDLADSWKVDEDGKIYTITLKQGLKWHDGQDLTADDVVFTFKTIQNPDAKSPLFNAWKGVKIESPDNYTVVFTLSNSLAPFIYSLTTGIVPKHSLADINPEKLRSAAFNTSSPIGSGPFIWDSIEIITNGKEPNLQNIGLKSFEKYQLGAPKLQKFVIKTYDSEEQLIESYQKQEVNGLVGLNNVPEKLEKDRGLVENTAPLTAQTNIFFRTDSEILKDTKIRQALVQAVDVPSIINGLGYTVIPANEPLLIGQIGYNSQYKQSPKNIEQANKLLDEAGWVKSPEKQFRTKSEVKLVVKLIAQNISDYSYLTQKIQKAWQDVGVETQVTLLSDTDLQDAVNGREYDALIYGISIGVDPDVFVYWHSSQADPRAASRLNFSNYKSTPADKSLEAGRSRNDVSLRTAKYIPFLQSWQSDAPAMALYQPRFLYITRGKLFGFEPKSMNISADRFNNVHNWMIVQKYKNVSN